jgi:hypothetical protein
VSAGIHGALAPAHFREGAGAGLGFVAATLVLAVLVVWLTIRPASLLAPAAATLVFVGLLGSYAMAVTSGLPLLHPAPEPISGLGLLTKAFEVVGFAAAASVLWRPFAALNPQPKGT